MGQFLVRDAGGEGFEGQGAQAVKGVVLDVAPVEPEGGPSL